MLYQVSCFKLFLVLIISLCFVSCENKVEKAKELWSEGRQEEALAKLKEELSKDPDNIVVKDLFEKYNGGSFTGNVSDLFLEKPVGEGFIIIATTKSDLVSEQERANLTTTTNSEGVFTVKNAIPGKRYEVKINMPDYFSNTISVEAPPKGETRVLQEKITIIKLPFVAKGAYGVYMVSEYGKYHIGLPSIFFPYGEDEPPRPEIEVASIPVYQGNGFIILGFGFGYNIDSGIEPVTGIIIDETAQIGRRYINMSDDMKTIETSGGSIRIIKPSKSLPNGIWAFRVRGYGNSYLFRVTETQQGNIQTKATAVITVEVLNACGVQGPTNEFTKYLRDRGFDVVNVGDYKGGFDLDQTFVIDRLSRGSENALKVADVLGVNKKQVAPQMDESLGVMVTVLIGKDHKSLHVYGSKQ